MMTSHPFSTQEIKIRTRDDRSNKRTRGGGPVWLGLLLTALAILMLAGLIYRLNERGPLVVIQTGSTPTSTANQPTELSPPPRPARPTERRGGLALNADPLQDPFSEPPSAESLAMQFPMASDYRSDSRRWIEGLYESELPLHAHNSVDDFLFTDLIKHDIQRAKLCSDAVFLRRVYFDAIGTLPTVAQTKEFLANPDPRKRTQLIDHLLREPEFADYWAMKWCDILRVKAEFPINLWPNAAQAYHRWIHTAIEENLPYDDFTRQLLTSSGSNFRRPQVNFYRALQSKEPEAIAEVVALTFMGARTDNWPAGRLEGMSQFFAKVGFKPTGEWKEEIVFFDRRRQIEDSASDTVSAIFPDGTSIEIPAGTDPRLLFADWLTNEDNPWFARAICNRIWYWLLGRGIVDPPDDVRHDNPATNLPLLNHLADELIANDYDLKHIYRLILDSSAYQLACIPQSEDPRAVTHFAFYQPRRHDAEVLIDAICQITGTTETYMSIIPEPYTFLPDHQRAIALPDGSITSSFLEMFGRPPRDTGMAAERNNRFTAAQALHLLNSNHIRNKLKRGPGMDDLLGQASNSYETAEVLYLAILTRPPTEAELHVAMPLCESSSGARELAWALINSDEFLFRH